MLVVDTAALDQQCSGYSPSEIYWIYNGLDCCVTLEVFETTFPQLDDVTGPIYRHDMEMAGPVIEMSLEGLPVDLSRRREVKHHYSTVLSQLEMKWARLCHEGLGIPLARTKRKGRPPVPISISSPKDVQFLFHDVLKVPEKKKRRKTTGAMSATTDRDTLEGFRNYYFAEPFVNMILAQRDQMKSIGFLNSRLDPDNHLRCSFNIAGTDTGRLSSQFSDDGTGTNLQNITGKLKDIFVAPPGWMFFDIDLEQGDSRGVGAIAWNMFVESHGEEWAGKYLDACESGDLHTTVCKMAWQDLAWGDDPAGWKAVAEQIAYRDLTYRDLSKKLGHGCLTSDHEVLTPTGWVSITESPLQIMQWSEQGSSFATVSNWIHKPYTGELQLFEGNSISALMTHDHRVPYKADQRTTGIKERPASMGPQAFMPLGSGWLGGDEVVPARLIAAFMADGTQEANWMCFHFHKDRKALRLMNLCEQYGFEYKINGNKVRVRGRLPKTAGAFQFNWAKECLEDFVDELKYWDGHQGKTAVSIHSSKRDQLEWFQTFGRIVGIGGIIQKPQLSGYGTVMYKLQQNNRQYSNGASVGHCKKIVERVPVHCPTVPTGWFYVRRNGKIFVTGNSNYMGQPSTMAMHTKMPVGIISDFQRYYFESFPCITAWQEETIRQLQEKRELITPWGRRRIFWNDPAKQSTKNAAIAFAPQSTTGEFTNRGLLNLWHHRNQKNLPIRFLVQVHDSVVGLVRQEAVADMMPLILKHMRVPLMLARDREFTIPHGAKVGWNYGKFDKALNPHGLLGWKGEELRQPPKRQSTFADIMDHR